MNTSSKSSYYEILLVSRQAQGSEIREAYHRLALKRHPDKNPGNPSAVVEFQELSEAYETLSDPGKRRIYDLTYCFSQQSFFNASQKSHSRQDAEALQRERRDKEWTAQSRARVNNIARLKKEVEAREAAIRENDIRERERKVTEDQGVWGYLVSFLSATPKKTEQEKHKEHQERLFRRAREATALRLATNALQQAEGEHHGILFEQNQTRAKEGRAKEEKLREEKLKEQRKEAARWKETYNKWAKEQEEVKKAKEAASRKSQEEISRKEKQRAKERKERDLRQELLSKLTAQNAQTEVSPQSTDQTGYPNQRQTQGSNPPPSQRAKASQTFAGAARNTACRHKMFWPKIEGSHQCSICHQSFYKWILQCPGCNTMACASCRKSLRGS